MGNDSSLPKTAGPQVQDAETKAAKPHKGAITNWTKVECTSSGLGYCIIGDFEQFDGKPGRTSFVVKHEGDEIETNNSRYTLAKATQADEAAKDRDHIAAPQSISKEDR